MSYEPVFRADVGDFSQLETASGLGIVRPDRPGGLWKGVKGWVSGRGDAAVCHLLSEPDAAVRMGISEVRLREIRDFHRELVGMGCRPFGCPPERMGSQYFYSTETLDHWFGER